ncbi:MAG: winged helix-turn-helix transcriptional regulator [Thermoplasmata archaeon]|nr:MAG: winged helix-turn-helix transcriptional regulator [Thermoplasmata archaeon]
MDKENLKMDPFKASSFISDKYAGKILAATYNSPKSAKQLSKKYNIPIAACYRRIRELEKLGLLVCAGIIYDSRGKGTKLYQSQLNGAYVYLLEERLKVHFKLASGISLTMVSHAS